MSYIPENTNVLSIAKVREMNPLVLAYIGDAVHSLYVRSKYTCNTTYKTNKLHILVSNEVKATNQSKIIEKILPDLEEEEVDIFHRARNAHVNTIAKNATRSEYLEATGLEALIGYWYLTGQKDRLEKFLEE